MNSLKRILTTAVAACFVCLLINHSVEAHDFLKKPVQERYGLKSVSCKVCHPGGNKAINNAFGMHFKEAFKGKNFTKRVKEAKALKKENAEEGTKKLDEVSADMIAAFKKVVPEIEKKTMTFAEMAKGGILNGTNLEKKVIAAMGKAQGVKEE